MEQSQELAQLPENPTPQDYGFPENPGPTQLRCWANQERFLEAFSRSGSVGAACSETGIKPVTAHQWGFSDTYSFKRRKELAAQTFLGKVEAEINRRAIQGTDKPVIYKGQITDTYKEYSDNLLMFRAKRIDPAYKDNYQPAPATTNNTQIVFNFHPSVPAPAPDSVVEQGASNSNQLPEPVTDSATETDA